MGTIGGRRQLPLCTIALRISHLLLCRTFMLVGHMLKKKLFPAVISKLLNVLLVMPYYSTIWTRMGTIGGRRQLPLYTIALRILHLLLCRTFMLVGHMLKKKLFPAVISKLQNFLLVLPYYSTIWTRMGTMEGQGVLTIICRIKVH